MVNAITDLVRNVTIIILIACFLEMLLPQGEIKKFVKAVLGLFILISMLNPILSLFDKKAVNEVLAWQDPIQEKAELDTILKKGEEISEDLNEKAIEMYKRNLAKQIETMVNLVKGVVWAEVEVFMKINNENFSYDGVEKIIIHAGMARDGEEGGIKKIEPIEIKVTGKESNLKEQRHRPDQEEVKKEIRETLKSFYNFREEQIQIVIISQDEEGKGVE
ncbi:MAG: stage III sporulation protein AF [Bacillota bacterium]|jgi:stage III sporulation protein AF|nr:stage III sporulation protein AF [Clostridia bacterium]